MAMFNSYMLVYQRVGIMMIDISLAFGDAEGHKPQELLSLLDGSELFLQEVQPLSR